MTPITATALTCSLPCIWPADGYLFQVTVVAEVGYLLAREGGARVESQFLSSLGDGTLSPTELTRTDYERAAQLVLEYASLPLGTTDATVIALSECLGLAEVATLDRRHFTIVRPRHVDVLKLLPE